MKHSSIERNAAIASSLLIAAAWTSVCSTSQGPADSGALSLTGAATLVDGSVRLTPAERNKAGAAWWPQKKRMREGFEAVFRFRISDCGGLEKGADGFAFVLQNSGPHALGGRGAAGGFALGDGYGNPDRPGIPESLAVFFDTFRNREVNDPSGNYIGVFNNGPTGKMSWPPPRLGFVKKLGCHLKDGREHSARIVYNPPLLSVFLDGGSQPVLTVPVDLTPVLDSSGSAYLGFTASTGDGYENHDILQWSVTSSTVTAVDSSIQFLNFDCMAGRNLCTPEKVIVEQRGTRTFHIVLPPTSQWPASIPNPANSQVDVHAAQGHVCWDLHAPPQTTCNAADGNILQKNENGRTWFSVKQPPGSEPGSSQGFFEFDASLRDN